MLRGGYVMSVNEEQIKSIIENVIANLGVNKNESKEPGLFDDM